ncbi:MAG: ABC transporter ATP-binding protein [Arachnia propionica]|uniref:ABC transporter ATP-binding protein n=1 Tax=Arachnia propionica TaxID=1750 RepID=UPI002700483D|nr:ABC transporter ATP-binding protein [Arachnia propionica]
MSSPVIAKQRPKHGPGRIQNGPGGPSGTGETAASLGPSLRRLLRQLRPQRVVVGIAVALSVASVVLSTLGPKILGHATDLLLAGIIGKNTPAGITREQAIEAAEGSGMGDMLRRVDFTPGQGIDFHAIGLVALIVVGVHVIAGIAAYLSSFLLIGAAQRSVKQLRTQVAAKLERLPLSYFDRQPRGELLSRTTNDIDNIQQTFQQTLPQFLNSLLTVLGVLVMMLWISWPLALVTIVSIPLSMVVVPLIMKRSQKHFAAMWQATGELNSEAEEAYTGHSLVKVFGRKAEVAASFHARNEELYRSSFGAQFLSAALMPVMFLVGNLNYVVVAVFGGLQVASGGMNIGDVQAFIQYSRQFTQPLTQLASLMNILQSGVASAERVFELLDAEEMTPEPGGGMQVERGEVVFDHVSFSYSPGRPLIRDLNLAVQPGQTVAIVGPTGAGKTTLVNLLMRFYDLDAGRILLDGVDIATVDRARLRADIGMVLQDTWLFGGTIRENIAYGRPGASEEEILAAAKAAFVDRFVHSLPEGYDTVIDEEGSNVSAGEKQLITIARAFLSEPALLILDEATSSVDTRTELLLQQAMSALRTGRTSFVIAHRLSTIKDADLILVMADGDIVEQGTHDDLLAAKGRYFELYQSQFDEAEE